MRTLSEAVKALRETERRAAIDTVLARVNHREAALEALRRAERHLAAAVLAEAQRDAASRRVTDALIDAELAAILAEAETEQGDDDHDA